MDSKGDSELEKARQDLETIISKNKGGRFVSWQEGGKLLSAIIATGITIHMLRKVGIDQKYLTRWFSNSPPQRISIRALSSIGKLLGLKSTPDDYARVHNNKLQIWKTAYRRLIDEEDRENFVRIAQKLSAQTGVSKGIIGRQLRYGSTRDITVFSFVVEYIRNEVKSRFSNIEIRRAITAQPRFFPWTNVSDIREFVDRVYSGIPTAAAARLIAPDQKKAKTLEIYLSNIELYGSKRNDHLIRHVAKLKGETLELARREFAYDTGEPHHEGELVYIETFEQFGIVRAVEQQDPEFKRVSVELLPSRQVKTFAEFSDKRRSKPAKESKYYPKVRITEVKRFIDLLYPGMTATDAAMNITGDAIKSRTLRKYLSNLRDYGGWKNVSLTKHITSLDGAILDSAKEKYRFTSTENHSEGQLTYLPDPGQFGVVVRVSEGDASIRYVDVNLFPERSERTLVELVQP